MGDPISVRWPPAELLEEDPVELYEQAPCGYLSTNAHGTIVKLNGTLLDWLGYRREEVVGAVRFQDLLSTPGRIFYQTHYVPLLQMQGRVREVAFDMVRKNGDELPVLVNATAKKDDSNALMLVRATIFNSTDRRAYERELLSERRHAEQSAAAKSRYLSMLSHDIRNPLTAIRLSANALRLTVRTAAERESLDIIDEAATEALNRIESILSYRRLESGNIAVESELFDLRRIIETCRTSVLPQANEKGVGVVVHIDPVLPETLMGDPGKIAQVLGNLVGNAVKFTESGSVTVRVETLESEENAITARISVTDTGIGISPDELGAIFEEFYQVDGSTARSSGSAGLGLSICREIIDLLGGTIRVSSTPGRGTQVGFDLRFSLPS